MNRITLIVLALSLALPTGGVFAAQPAPSATTGAPPAQDIAAGAHLGVGIESVPPALAAQLPPAIPRGQGVLIGRVEPDSPAAAAGLRPYDILLSYDDQKLFSPDQLHRLVAADQPGRIVTLKRVRGGQLQTVQVTLGQGAPRTAMPQHGWSFPFHFPRNAFPVMPRQRQETLTESFESLNVEKLEDGRYRAAIEYLDADGNRQRYEFEGTWDELHKQIGQSKDLSPAARKHLLNTLNMNTGWPMRHFWRPLDFEELMRTWREGGWMQY